MYRPVKRAIDILVGGTVLLLTAPLQVVLAVLVRRNLGSPVLFKQARPGLNEEIFELRKFRTMRDVDEERGLVTDADRLTPFGRMLRSTSLDELPSLWNVVRGDMSLVGPRPLLVRYLERYSPAQRRRHAVRPGLTGWAQINGRNALSWDQKFAYDIEYVDNVSLTFDLRILWMTALKVIQRDGISGEGEATMVEFMGRTDG